ncbi:Ribose operon repressor [Flagellimonas maritima]|uniref:Ribose operon repressor n=1 Tax=Flagellimonas maritima TaxID=1383885 RepID=A0A2Z4LT93_9FLAO|nr:substrate-binding domain-containing protein [Allomuricauda aurantiaca]AWX44949.1 Ribose operon repressor [Allomuricauda aurantiaca]
MVKKPSLKDIAKKAEVSIATVSYVLTRGTDSGISPQVSEKIRKIARELNYRPNQIAQSLQSGKTYSIGLIVADISNPFFANIARIIEDEAKRYNYTVIFGSSDENAKKSADLLTFLVDRQVDGFIIAPAEHSEKQLKLLKKEKIPFVLIDRYFPNIESNFVIINNFDSTFNATKKLIDSGHKKIGMVGYDSKLNHMKERIRGYSEAMENAGSSRLEKNIKTVKFESISEEISLKIEELLLCEQPVTAILFATNTLAIHGMKSIDALKLSVPEDVSVIVFDASDAFDFYSCPLTYIQQPLLEIGTRAVNVLIEKIDNPSENFSKVHLQTKLVLKDSVSIKKPI